MGKDALCEVLSGERLVHFHSHRADDIMTVLRMQREFGFKVLIQHGMEAWKVADELAEANVPVSLHSDDGVIDSRFMFRHAAMAVRAGMSREGALRALTINGAVQMGLDDKVGSLEVGKDADLVILNGDPLSVYTHVMETWVEGEKLFDRSKEEDLLMAQGGYGAGNPMEAAHYHWELAEAEGGQ